MATMLHTLGDSTLDNLYWMLPGNSLKKGKKISVEGQLRERGHKVVSHAFDGFTTRSVLEGDHVGAVLAGCDKSKYMKEKARNGSFATPLNDLREKVSKRTGSTHYVAISVGGNDFRVNLGRPWKLLSELSQVQKRYLQILDQVKELPGKDVRPLLIFHYRTDANNDPYAIYTIFGAIGTVAVAMHITCLALLTAPVWATLGYVSPFASGLALAGGGAGLYGVCKVVPVTVTKNVLLGGKVGLSLFGGVLETFYKPILERAKQEKIPILDLPNTFDPFANLYECGIEPNEKGGALIAEGIDHIVRNHNYSGESLIYSRESGASSYSSKPNRNWKVS